MQRKAKFVAALLILALLLVTACGGGGAAPAAAPADTGAEAADDSAAAPAEDAASEDAAAAAPVNPYIVDDSEPRFPEQVFDSIPAEFHEAPMLAEMVTAGELPPVEERLPSEPMVLKPAESIGVYGGSLNGAFTGPADHQNAERMLKNHMIFWDTGMTEVQPHIAKAFEANADNTEFTFHLREGMKWSDGEPFTADDVMFWYEDIMLNDDLLPAKPGWTKAGGESGVWEKIDDYTFKVSFTQSYGTFFELVAGLTVNGHYAQLEPCTGSFSPKHYMTQFHADYIGLEEANALAAEKGFDNWTKL
ncbi:MAG: hypothetical protein KDE58_08930, partial [Caldilineaceae bacterium]|nr:hypothetical protein [Caldilineaceae bacterium]